VAEDGTMLNYERVESDSDIDEPRLVKCVEHALKGSRFLPPPLGINRYIAFDFAEPKTLAHTSFYPNRQN
jgi:hypothetical protein